MAEQKRQDFQIPTGRSVDAGEERRFTMLPRENHQPCENSGGVAIGCFPNWVWAAGRRLERQLS